VLLDWSLQNQIIVAGSLGVAGPIGAAVIIVHDNRKGHRDAKQDADQKRQELNRFFDEKFSVLQEANLNTQRLILACASGTLKGFQGDMTEIESFVKSFEVFEKAMGCAKVDGRGEQ